MKAGLLVFAAAFGSAVASSRHQRHEAFHHRRGAGWNGDVPSYFNTDCCQKVVTVTVCGTATPLPTPLVTTCPTPGTYTVTETTVTVSHTHTVVANTGTTLTPGTNTFGGYTTSVTAPTTITWPHETTDTTVTCPSAGACTPIAPTTVVVSESTVTVCPVPMTFSPGTYIRAATTVTAIVTEDVFVCPFQYTSTTTLMSTNVVTVTAAGATSPANTPPAAPVQNAQTSSPAPPAQSSSSNSGFPTNGNKWAFTYTPYTSSGQCKTPDEVMADIAVIAGKGFLVVRLYATDCSGLQNVGAACQANNLKMIIGVFIEASGISGAQEQVTEIAEWGQSGMWELVILAVIGNEAIFNNYCTPEELAGFISSTKATWQQSGYHGPCTTTEPLNILQESAGSLCGVIDVVASNIHSYFTSSVVAEQAGTFVQAQLELVGLCCPGLEAYNLESGWPSAGQANGQAVPGTQEQQAALLDILDKVGSRTCFFSFANDQWKDPGQFGVEQWFGAIGVF